MLPHTECDSCCTVLREAAGKNSTLKSNAGWLQLLGRGVGVGAHQQGSQRRTVLRSVRRLQASLRGRHGLQRSALTSSTVAMSWDFIAPTAVGACTLCCLAVWVWCGDEERCLGSYNECWLKHLVSVHPTMAFL